MISFQIRYQIAQIKYFLTETVPWKIAWLLPPRIALFAFVRVFAIREDCPDAYSETYNMWTEKYGLK